MSVLEIFNLREESQGCEFGTWIKQREIAFSEEIRWKEVETKRVDTQSFRSSNWLSFKDQESEKGT